MQPTQPSLSGFIPKSLIRGSCKSAVWAGVYEEREVVYKELTNHEPFWKGRFTNEVNIYQCFADCMVEVPAPRMLWHSTSALIVDRIDGYQLSNDRYPTSVDRSTFELALEAVYSLPHVDIVQKEPAMNYPARIQRYEANGIIDANTAERLRRLSNAAESLAFQFQHGDVVPSNIFRTPNGIMFIDWEFAGYYLPGYDLALLATFLIKLPWAPLAINQLVHTWPKAWQIGYWLNESMVLTREIRILAEANIETVPQVTERWDFFRRCLQDEVENLLCE